MTRRKNKGMFTMAATLVAALIMIGQVSCVAQKKEKGFKSIFDGKTLKGWDGDTKYWRVENGSLVGEITPETLLKTNSFIIWQGGEPGDFELKGSFKIAEKGNSGINYRSEKVADIPNALRGYQADIDGAVRYTGQNYEERKRTTLGYRGEIVTVNNPTDKSPEAFKANLKNNAWLGRTVTGSLGTSDELKTKIKSEDWNEFHIVAKGNRLQHFINGVLMSDVTDNDGINGKSSGYLGIQVHVGPPMKVEYKDLRIKQ
ncbi:DUF1080 domain-containing protein [Dyadobacter sp. 32]|uniref:3-keto-disaccharide hydrolase n=1 Tax=Dyadobacter sp. 32 TaxID=538966 RepID=UPI0011EBD494